MRELEGERDEARDLLERERSERREEVEAVERREREKARSEREGLEREVKELREEGAPRFLSSAASHADARREGAQSRPSEPS